MPKEKFDPDMVTVHFPFQSFGVFSELPEQFQPAAMAAIEAFSDGLGGQETEMDFAMLGAAIVTGIAHGFYNQVPCHAPSAGNDHPNIPQLLSTLFKQTVEAHKRHHEEHGECPGPLMLKMHEEKLDPLAVRMQGCLESQLLIRIYETTQVLMEIMAADMEHRPASDEHYTPHPATPPSGALLN